VASATHATAVGYSAQAGHSYGTAVGDGAATTTSHQIVLGTSSENVLVPGDLNVTGSVSGGTIVGGGADRIPAAQDFTTTTLFSVGKVAVMGTGTYEDRAIALMLTGDTHVRFLLTANGSISFGDGSTGNTCDLYIDSGKLRVYSNTRIMLEGSAVEVSDGDVVCSGGGPVLYSPNSTAYRIVVSNAGVLSTVTA
jgi:hypothetical protein